MLKGYVILDLLGADRQLASWHIRGLQGCSLTAILAKIVSLAALHSSFLVR